MRKRLRKKLRRGEFTERGFAVAFTLAAPAGSDAALDIVDALLAQAIEPRGLAFYGGGGQLWSAFIKACGRRSVSEADRDSVLGWLRSRPDIADVRAGQLIDAWNSREERFDDVAA
jgi:uncharacterized protein YggL (DUF469 family)